MSRALVILNTSEARQKAARWCVLMPPGTRVTFQETKRTPPQNAMMWSLLTEVSVKARWHGLKLSPDDWKLIFLDALAGESRTVPSLDGERFVSLRRSSELSIKECGEVIGLIDAWAATNGIMLRVAA